MVLRDRGFFQQGVNVYVNAMQHSAELVSYGPQLFSLGTPALATQFRYQTGLPLNVSAGTINPIARIEDHVDATYGRAMAWTPSADPGNACAVDVIGEDYLGQPMVERFVGASGSTAALFGKKAFYRVFATKVTVPSVNPITYSLGNSWTMGMPYKGIITISYEGPTILSAVDLTVPTFTPADITDPATATTGDPRGTYQSKKLAYDGSTVFSICIIGNSGVNAAGNGGLHGIRQYAG
jgi:hypothetical protein